MSKFKEFLMVRKIFQNIFKLILQKFFILFYGSIKDIEKNIKEIGVTIRYISETKLGFKYKVYFIPKSFLYTDRIQDTAIIKEKKILDGPSFQLRKNINSDTKNNIALKIGTPRFRKKLNGTVFSLLTGGGGNNNYFHWLFDVLPRIGIYESIEKLENIDYFLLPNLNKWQIETLDELLIPRKKLLSSLNYRHLSAEKIVVTDHPWQNTKDVIYDLEHIPLWISFWLKKKFIKNENKKSFPKKIYIDRSDSESNLASYRGIINEEEVIKFLKKNDFHPIQLSKLSFQEEIQLFNGKKIIVGLQGAGLSNMIWSKEGTKVIEIRSKYTNKLYENLAIQNKINYSSIILEPKSGIVWPHYGMLEVPIIEIEKALNS